MPRLLRGIARTAAVAGTATAVSNRVSRRQAGRWAAHDQQSQSQPEAEPAPQPPARYEGEPSEPPPRADAMTDELAQLRTLGELKAQGVLTQEEFDRQKQRILGTP